MSLDYNLTSVHDYEGLHESDLEWNITQALIFHTMGAGMGDITESNWQGFYARVAFFESLYKPSLTVPNLVEYNPLTEEPPPNTEYIVVDDGWYYYDGVDPEFVDEWEEPVDPNQPDGEYHLVHEVKPALMLTEYEHTGMGPHRGMSMVQTIDPDSTYQYHAGFEQRPITPQDVHRRIGLHTNVGTETEAKWRKRIVDNYMREAKYRADSSVTLT